MSYGRLWLLLLTADWTVRVVAGIFVAKGLALTAETWLGLLVVPPLEAAALSGAFRIRRAMRDARRSAS